MPPTPTANKCIFGFENCYVSSNNINMKPYTFFIGYQVDSQYYKQHTMNLLGSHICEYLKNDLKKLNLQVLHKPFGFRNGIHILCDACKLIQKSILCIFEISDLNPNVMLEIGKSLYKNIVLLRRSSSDFPVPDIPSDLEGVFYESYDNEEELINSKSGKIANIIYDRIIENQKNYFPRKIFYLKNEISKICKDNTFNENIDWGKLLEIYDESKLTDAHDYTLIGIAKYKKLKSEYINDNFDIKYFKEVKKYFEKSRKLNNKIIENEYYLYNLDLLNTGNNFVNKDNNITDDLIASQKNLEDLVNECKEVVELIINFSNTSLNKFLFIDSPMLIEISTGYSTYNLGFGIGNFKFTKIYNILKFLAKKRIIKNFNKIILDFLKMLPSADNYNSDRFQIIELMGKDFDFDDIGEEIIKSLKRSLEVENLSSDNIYGENYKYVLDKDLKNKLSYLLGIFGDIRAENILISLIDNNKDGIIYPAIDSLAKINSIKSLPIIINIYKNLSSDYNIKPRASNSIRILCEKNNIIGIIESLNLNN